MVVPIALVRRSRPIDHTPQNAQNGPVFADRGPVCQDMAIPAVTGTL